MTEWKVPTLIVAADWLAGHPAAVDRARALADHATENGEVAELVTALLDCVGVALGGTGNVQRARRRLENRAMAAADAACEAAAEAGRYRHREGQ